MICSKLDGITLESDRWVKTQWPAVNVIQSHTNATVSPYKYVVYINEEYTMFYRGNKTTSAKCPRSI